MLKKYLTGTHLLKVSNKNTESRSWIRLLSDAFTDDFE